MTVTDERKRNRSRRVQIRKETAHRVRVKRYFLGFDRMFHTVLPLVLITKNRSARSAPNGLRFVHDRIKRHGRRLPLGRG